VLLIVAGFVVTVCGKRHPQFGLMQMAVGIILFVFVIWVLAFWPERWTHVLSRPHKPR